MAVREERNMVGYGQSVNTAGVLYVGLLMVTPDDGWRGHALRELLPRLSARFCF